VSMRTFSFPASVTVALAIQAAGAEAQTTPDAPVLGRPEAVINLATTEGVQLVKGQWHYSDTKIIEVDHRSPGPDLRSSGPPNKTYDITPHAEAAEFDDANGFVA
jgi:gluconolactonase